MEFQGSLTEAVTPPAWALAGYQDAVARGPRAVLGGTAILLGFAAVFCSFARWRFRFD